MRSSSRPRFGMVLAAVGLLAAVAAPMALGTTGKATGTVIVKVKYKTPEGKKPLAGVEVFLWDGEPNYACTNNRGVAKFTDVDADASLITVTGYGVTDTCENWEFANPDNGKSMWLVGWRNRHGEGPFDNFTVDAGGKRVMKLREDPG